jgi:hypothetical protein
LVLFEDRLDGFIGQPRPGPARSITDDRVEKVVKTLEEKPLDVAHWSSRSMAAAPGMNQSAMVRTRKAFGLQPWRADSCKLSTDTLFIDKLHDIYGLYLDPPGAGGGALRGRDSQIQALDRAQPILPLPARHARTAQPRLCATRPVFTDWSGGAFL